MTLESFNKEENNIKSLNEFYHEQFETIQDKNPNISNAVANNIHLILSLVVKQSLLKLKYRENTLAKLVKAIDFLEILNEACCLSDFYIKNSNVSDEIYHYVNTNFCDGYQAERLLRFINEYHKLNLAEDSNSHVNMEHFLILLPVLYRFTCDAKKALSNLDNLEEIESDSKGTYSIALTLDEGLSEKDHKLCNRIVNEVKRLFDCMSNELLIDDGEIDLSVFLSKKSTQLLINSIANTAKKTDVFLENTDFIFKNIKLINSISDGSLSKMECACVAFESYTSQVVSSTEQLKDFDVNDYGSDEFLGIIESQKIYTLLLIPIVNHFLNSNVLKMH